jgi:pyruvate formate lyase activating enzyme
MDLAVEDIIRRVERDAVFYRASGGGVTFSGGEPFARMDLLRYLVEALYSAGIRIAVETCGFFVIDEVLDILEKMDEIFVDLKHTHDATHRKLTGVSNRIIIENISRMDEAGHALTIRVPLVKGLTDTRENMEGLIRVCKGLKNLKQVELLPYHSLGAGKYADLNLAYDHSMTAPGPEEIQSILTLLNTNGIKASSGIRFGKTPNSM